MGGSTSSFSEYLAHFFRRRTLPVPKKTGKILLTIYNPINANAS